MLRAGLTLLGLILCCLRAGALAAGTATLTVGSEPQQTFAGLGLSFEQRSAYADLPESEKALVDELLFEALDTRIVRLWYGPGDPEPVYDSYVRTGLVPRAIANGVTEILLGPWDYLDDPHAHAQAIASDIVIMRRDYGIPVTATGVVNEPHTNPGERKYLPEWHYVPLALAMRDALAAAGITDVTVLGPEFASADAGTVLWFDTVAAEPEALAAVDALASHSYNMAANRELAERALAAGKEYWMTEAGGGVTEGSAEFDYHFAATAPSRFLNDLNNGVTHWVWFLGVGEGVRDPYQKLVMCDPVCAAPERIYKNYAYHHLQQASAAFPPGTTLRHVTSDLPGFEHMVYTYGEKPALHAAAGVRPDGGWAIGVVNDTTGRGWARAQWPAPEDYTVTIRVPELASDAARSFELCRTNTEVAVQCGEEVVLEQGEVTLEVKSLELITLVERAGAG